MEKKDILGKADHTLLKQTAAWGQVETPCKEGVKHVTASVRVPPYYMKRAKEHTGENLTTCTVIGFSNGDMTTVVKVFEIESTARSDAGEINMVINTGVIKRGPYEQVLEEIRQIKAAYAGECLEVVVEACLLTENEKKEMCHVVTQSGADYIKTSTGFSTGGATREDVVLSRKHSSPRVKVKAAGGITSLQDAEGFIVLGTDRLGTSGLVPQRCGMCRNMECAEI